MNSRSGLQNKVLQLYRDCHRAIQKKPEKVRPNFYKWLHQKFRSDARSVSAKDINSIEYLLRRGQRELEMLKSPHVTSIQP